MSYAGGSMVAQHDGISTIVLWRRPVINVRSPLLWLVVTLVLSLISFSLALYFALPHVTLTAVDAAQAGLLASAVLLVTTAISGIFVLQRKQLGLAMRYFLCLLLTAGILWSLFCILLLTL